MGALGPPDLDVAHAPAGLERLSRLGVGHDGVLVPGERGLDLFKPS